MAAQDTATARYAAAWVEAAAAVDAWDRRGGTPPMPVPGGPDLAEALGVAEVPTGAGEERGGPEAAE